jgi:hypothetical protein
MRNRTVSTLPLRKLIQAVIDLRFQENLSWAQMSVLLGIERRTLWAICSYPDRTPVDRHEILMRAFFDLSEPDRVEAIERVRGTRTTAAA